MTGSAYPLSSVSFYNGVLQDVIPMSDRGFLFGDGLFETMLIRRGCIPLLAFHLKRLRSGCATLGIPLNEKQLMAHLDAVLVHTRVSALALGKVRLTVTVGEGGEASYSPRECLPSICIQVVELCQLNEANVELLVAPLALPQQGFLAGIKHINRLAYIAATRNMVREAGQEALFLDGLGNVVETMHHNIFFIRGDTVFTPGLDTCGVKGVGREVLFARLSEAVGFSITSTVIPYEEVSRYDSCFLTNAVHGVIPVRRVGDHHFQVVALLKRIQRAFRALVLTNED